MSLEPLLARLRDDAAAVFRRAVEAADPHRAVSEALETREGGLRRIAGRDASEIRRWTVVAFGKAACAMARAALERLPAAALDPASLAVTNRENLCPLPPLAVLGAGHPLPDAAGVEASRRVLDALEGPRADQRLGGGGGGVVRGVLGLVSGGGSALLPAPAAGITLADKTAVTDLLLASGATIGEMNTVRKHLSALKGGGLARAAAPARVEALILSDVIGDDLSTIASGPTAPDPTTFADAREVLASRGIWERCPPRVRERIEAGCRGEIPETPKPGDPLFARVRNTLVGSNSHSLEAARGEAERRGYAARIVSRELCGEARRAGARLAALLERLGPGEAALAGGETTVTVTGPGRGGRNQELALAFALEARHRRAAAPWVFLSAGTDGRDGPTDAAGGLVDPETVARAEHRGVSAERALEENDSYTFLEAAGALLRTGATGTNVADLQVLLLARG